MQYRVYPGFLSALLLCMVLAGAVPVFATSQAPALEEARRDYSDAVSAIRRGKWGDYEKLRPGLEEYPLALYLDYYELTSRLHRVSAVEAQAFLERSADSPLSRRFLSVYLKKAGERRRWPEFLALMPQEPNSTELKCYFYRAHYGTGDKVRAFEGAANLWLHGKSQPKACDPLFTAWKKSGGLDDELVWGRMLLAFEERQGSLLRYVSRSGSDALAPWSDRLLKVFRDPSRLTLGTLPVDHPRTHDLVVASLSNLARYSPERALESWEVYREVLDLSLEDMREVERAITLRALFARTDSLRDWLDFSLRRLADDKLAGIRLRWAIGEKDWEGVRKGMSLLSEAEREKSGWRYWQAVALHAAGDARAGNTILESLASERGYYSFLAADTLGRDYAFNASVPIALDDTAALRSLPAVQRVGELTHHDAAGDAHSEWSLVLSAMSDPEQQVQLAQLASSEGWHRMAIDAANRARAWDALDLRFPTPFREVFDSHAEAQRVSGTELMAIARRESAFFPEARSSAGARGLMQIMPATGAQVARRIGEPHRRADLYEVEHNVLLGSAYYKQLLDRYNGNRVLALAAYNAGPHRVDRWRNEGSEQLPVDLWIETIPFKETREYVQAVLAYNVVFQYLLGDTHSLLTVKERKARY